MLKHDYLLKTVNVNSGYKNLLHIFLKRENVRFDKMINFFLCTMVNKELILGVGEVSSL